MIPIYWHLLSLDAPSVAVLWAWSLARAVGAEIAGGTLAVLGIGTWLLYVADRLLDVRVGAVQRDLRERHFFHERHRKMLLIAAGVVVVPLLWLIVARLPAAARREDAWIFAAVVVYFGVVHTPWPRLRLPREPIVGAVFACACAVPAWSVAGYAHAELAVLAVLLAALGWLNCSAIHAWEGRDRPGGWFVSVLAVAIAAAAGAFVLAARHNPGEMRLAVALLAAAMLFFALDRDFRRSPGRRDSAPSALTLRVLADAILLTPLLLLIPWRG